MSKFNKDLPNNSNKGPVRTKTELKFLKKLGVKIQYLIRKDGGRLEDFCYENEISRSGMSHIIAGEKNVKVLTLLKISKGLGYKDLAEFFSEI